MSRRKKWHQCGGCGFAFQKDSNTVDNRRTTGKIYCAQHCKDRHETYRKMKLADLEKRMGATIGILVFPLR